MATKSEYSEEVNEILGTELDFSKMPKDDLELFYELIDEGELLEPQAKHIAKKYGKDKLEQQVDEWHPGKYALRLL